MLLAGSSPDRAGGRLFDRVFGKPLRRKPNIDVQDRQDGDCQFQSQSPPSFTGVGIENNRACGWDFTPILAFPRQGGRDWLAEGSGVFVVFPADSAEQVFARVDTGEIILVSLLEGLQRVGAADEALAGGRLRHGYGYLLLSQARCPCSRAACPRRGRARLRDRPCSTRVRAG